MGQIVTSKCMYRGHAQQTARGKRGRKCNTRMHTRRAPSQEAELDACVSQAGDLMSERALIAL